MEANNPSQKSAYPVVLQAAKAALASCKKLESDFRNTGDFCHNNIGAKTYEDWENMDKFLLNAADEMGKMRKCVELLVTVSSRQKLRNCDVGTEQEQFERWQAFCNKYDDDCTGCPCDGITGTFTRCFAEWAQMPYEEGATK